MIVTAINEIKNKPECKWGSKKNMLLLQIRFQLFILESFLNHSKSAYKY